MMMMMMMGTLADDDGDTRCEWESYMLRVEASGIAASGIAVPGAIFEARYRTTIFLVPCLRHTTVAAGKSQW